MKIVNQKVELVNYMGTDLTVVDAARVSFSKQSDWEYEIYVDELDQETKRPVLSVKDQKLLAYLARHNHWSPFAHTSLQFRVKAPIFVARQLVKHQVGGVWNEVSRRYVDEEPEFYLPSENGWRGRPVNAKQGSDGIVEVSPRYVESRLELLKVTYDELLQNGVAPEQARMILPQNTMTEWIWTGSLMFFARVCKLRLDAHAQQETQEIAKMINDLIPSEFQHSWKALMNDTV